MIRISDYITLKFASPFAKYAEEYIECNRAIGDKYNVHAVYLMQFDAFCVAENIDSPNLTSDLMEKWCKKRLHETDRSHHIRVRSLRKFAKYLANNGLDAPSEFHPLPHLSNEFIPYIFTRDEVGRFLAATEDVKRNGHNPTAYLTMRILFRLLYCCGLRVSEALNLKLADVELENGILRILDSKNEKDRLVPMSDTLRLLCVDYRNNHAVKSRKSEFFFPAPDGGRYANCTIYTRFRKFLWKAGIPHGGRGKGPRLHDLRHSFAIHTLDDWARDGKDLYVCLPILSVYLGHKNLQATQQYLRLTHEAYPALLAAFERDFGCVFPENHGGAT